MSSQPVTCETVALTVNNLGPITLPAFTRDLDDFDDVVEGHMDEYLSLVQRTGGRVSVADFALFLISKAAQEPRVMEATS